MNDRGMSQADLARAAKVTPSAINSILMETRKPGPDLCLGIAMAFGMSPTEVFKIAGLLPPSADENDPLLERIEHLYSSLSPESRERASEFLEFLLQQDGKRK